MVLCFEFRAPCLLGRQCATGAMPPAWDVVLIVQSDRDLKHYTVLSGHLR
jgi:hypothetical protein